MLFVLLGAIFLANALIAEMVGGKLFQLQLAGLTLTLSAGALLWPVVTTLLQWPQRPRRSQAEV